MPFIEDLAAGLGALVSRVRGPGAWNDANIEDEWFRSHFHYAADVVHGKLSVHCDPTTATIMDFGCYDGITALGLALRHRWHRVIGVDIDPGFRALPRMAREQIGLRHLPANVRFRRIRPGQSLRALGPVDAILSWSVFEHVERSLLDAVVADLRSALKPGGSCFVQIDPLYYSPNGSHLGRVALEPWMHLLITPQELEARVMAATPDLIPPDEITEQFRSMPFEDYKRMIHRHYLELNRITADELIALFERHGFVLDHQVRHRTPLEVPPRLLEQYEREALTVHEVIAVFRAA